MHRNFPQFPAEPAELFIPVTLEAAPFCQKFLKGIMRDFNHRMFVEILPFFCIEHGRRAKLISIFSCSIHDAHNCCFFPLVKRAHLFPAPCLYIIRGRCSDVLSLFNAVCKHLAQAVTVRSQKHVMLDIGDGSHFFLQQSGRAFPGHAHQFFTFLDHSKGKIIFRNSIFMAPGRNKFVQLLKILSAAP